MKDNFPFVTYENEIEVSEYDMSEEQGKNIILAPTKIVSKQQSMKTISIFNGSVYR